MARLPSRTGSGGLAASSGTHLTTARNPAECRHRCAGEPRPRRTLSLGRSTPVPAGRASAVPSAASWLSTRSGIQPCFWSADRDRAADEGASIPIGRGPSRVLHGWDAPPCGPGAVSIETMNVRKVLDHLGLCPPQDPRRHLGSTTSPHTTRAGRSAKWWPSRSRACGSRVTRTETIRSIRPRSHARLPRVHGVTGTGQGARGAR